MVGGDEGGGGEVKEVLLECDWRGGHWRLGDGLRREERIERGELVVTRPGGGGGQGRVGGGGWDEG